MGKTATALNRGTTLETMMDNFLLQALLENTGAQLAFSNGWRYGAPVIPGEVTLNDLYNIIPMNPPISTVELTGEEIVAMLEENLQRAKHRGIKNIPGQEPPVACRTSGNVGRGIRQSHDRLVKRWFSKEDSKNCFNM
ncbi:5'-nucleotidase C-terminal domain-containing protein [Desulfocastanea catecholica]